MRSLVLSSYSAPLFVGISLYLPGGEGPFPACIIPMGAANYERWIYAMEARLLAAHGIATLIYDNYGSGIALGLHSRWISGHPFEGSAHPYAAALLTTYY